jgi:hypothetical protein
MEFSFFFSFLIAVRMCTGEVLARRFATLWGAARRGNPPLDKDRGCRASQSAGSPHFHLLLLSLGPLVTANSDVGFEVLTAVVTKAFIL